MHKPKLMFDHDSRHSLIYLYEPPIYKEQIEAAVDELAGTPVDAIMWTLGEGRTMLHDTKVGEKWGHNVEKWPHIVFQRAQRNLEKLISEGNDPLQVVCDQAHKKGLLLYPNLILQQSYTEPGTDPRSSNFRFENRHLEIGVNGDLDETFPGKTYLDFKHKEVQDERFNIVQEVLNNYPVDGFELNFNLFAPIFFHPSEVEEGQKTMTQWVKRVYEEVKKSGTDRELTVVVPLDTKLALEGGLDTQEWISQGIVDVVVGQQFSLAGPPDSTANFGPLVEAAKGTNCRIHGAIHSGLDSDRMKLPSIEVVRAVASNYYQQGVDGLYLAHWFAYWPYGAEFYEMLRELPHEDIMAPKDKIHIVPTQSMQPVNEKVYGKIEKQLPQSLEVSQTVTVNFRMSDDLNRWNSMKRLHEIILRIRIDGYTEQDSLKFALNVKKLPESLLRQINRMYMMSAPRYRVGGQWFIFRLDNANWPNRGENQLEVTLIDKDPKVRGETHLRDVELEIKYLMGKNFHRGYVDQDLGPYDRSTS